MAYKCIEVRDIRQLNNEVEAGTPAVILFSSSGCCVCHADLPRIKTIAEDVGIPLIHVPADEVPEAAGQMSVFTVPTVLLYFQNREYHRQSRFIDFKELEKRMREIV